MRDGADDLSLKKTVRLQPFQSLYSIFLRCTNKVVGLLDIRLLSITRYHD